MIDPKHGLPVKRLAAALGLARSRVYSQPVPLSPLDLDLMRRIDELHLAHPFAGSRMMKRLRVGEGHGVGRRHVTTLMRRMGIEALYRKPRTTRKDMAHAVHPYLLRGVAIDRPNHVWAMNITYIPMKQGFVYFTAVMDGKGAWRDNVFIERFWRTLKYEAVYLRAYESVSDARSHLQTHLSFYDNKRPHSSLEDRTPDAVYFPNTSIAELKEAA